MNLANRKTVRFASTLALGTVALAVQADRVELTNGDVLTGDVVQSDERGVVLKHPVLGTIPITADRISEVILEDVTPEKKGANNIVPTPPEDASEPREQAAPAPETKSDTKPKTKPDTKQPDTKQIQAAAANTAAAKESNSLQAFFKDWNSRLTLGLNGSTGPTDRKDYRVKFKTGFEDGRDRWNFDTSWFYATANGNKTQNQVQANLTKDWLQKDAPWFFFVKGQYKYDVNRSWENRTSAFGGGGYTITKTDDVEVNTRLGFGGTYEYGSVNDFTPEALFGGSVIKWHITDRAAISGETTYYPSLEDSTEFRVESSIEWTYKLDMAKGLSLKLGIENEYDSKTPNEDVNNDLRYYGALVLSF